MISKYSFIILRNVIKYTLPKNHLLSSLLQGILVHQLIGNSAAQVQAISSDSRAVSKATLFVAIRGTKADGHVYIQQAVTAGSTVVVCERLPGELAPHVTYVVVSSSTQALGTLAANFYGNPAAQLRLVAVTGTNGKTSTVHLLAGMFRHLGCRVGMLSTIQSRLDQQILPADLTTPDALQLHALLARMVDQGCTHCFMEASSHAMVQGRLAGVPLAGAVFMNITHEHLDYHATFDAYIQAKKKLFDALPAGAFALYNGDDRRGAVMVQNTKAACHSFALKRPASFVAKVLTNTLQGLELRIADQTVWCQLVGTFNASNLLAAYATACLLGVDGQAALLALSAQPPVQGRCQHLRARGGFEVIVDYAHTPDALKNVLKALGAIKSKAGKIITVLGCGGDRDQQKRPLMAQAALRHSGQVIFTTDNPRNEVPEAIIRDMQVGMTAAQQQRGLVIVDRAAAIKTACQLAQPNDVVLVAGKGHETYQEIRGKRYPFDDGKLLQSLVG